MALSHRREVYEAVAFERTFFNAAPAPIARNFQTSVLLPIPKGKGETLPGEQVLCPGHGCLHFTRLGFSRGPLLRGRDEPDYPKYILHQWIATGDRGLAATLYGPCSVNALAGPASP